MLREDKTFFFAHGGVLAYRVLRETAVVSGDPVGPEGSAGPIVAGFLALAHRRGWRVAMTGVSPRQVEDYRRLGLRALRVGEEAFVDPRAFSLEGRHIRKVRQSVTRARRRGWVTEAHVSPEVPTGDWPDIVELEREWQVGQQRTYGFAMTLGRMGGAVEDERMLYVLGRDPDGRVRALLRFLPYGSGLSLDAMRRAPDVPNGLTEALVVHALEHARATGAREVSLNFAGFGHIMAEGRELSTPQRLARVALGAAHSRFQLERLWAFNQKFEPQWRPRYLVYGSRTQLPRAALRVLQAEAYLRPPRCPARAARWSTPPSVVRP
jgi:lysyl-tRNA synthetase class 2